MHSDGKAHQERDQDDPAVGVPPVRGLVPSGHGPDHDGGEERTHRIDFTFDGGEPESVGESIRKGAYGS